MSAIGLDVGSKEAGEISKLHSATSQRLCRVTRH